MHVRNNELPSYLLLFVKKDCSRISLIESDVEGDPAVFDRVSTRQGSRSSLNLVLVKIDGEGLEILVKDDGRAAPRTAGTPDDRFVDNKKMRVDSWASTRLEEGDVLGSLERDGGGEDGEEERGSGEAHIGWVFI
jgi:hypothetical protein